MSNAKLNVQEAPTEIGVGRMPMDYAERKSTITSIEVQPSNVRGDRLINICPSKGNGNEETMRLRHLIFRFTKWFRPLISDILSQEENLAMFEELAMEGVGEIVVSNLHSEENRPSMNQRDNHGIDQLSMQYSNNNKKGETLILEENLAEFEELTQVGVTVIVTSLASGDMRASDQQPNHSIIEHSNVYKGDGKGHGECHNASYSGPDNDLDYEIEQIMVDALTMQRREDSLPLVPGNTNPNLDHHKVLTDGNAIQIPSTCHLRSMKQPLIELADEESKMEQTVWYKNENFTGGCHTPNDDSIIPPSASIEKQEENKPSNKERLDLNAQPASNILIGVKEGSSISEQKANTSIEVEVVEVIEPSSLSGATRKTTEENIEKVLKWLSDENVETIGLQGKNGIGKTWTARRVVDIATESGLFDVVIWVNVGSYSLKNMQMQIIDQLKLSSIAKDNEEETEKELRHTIYMSLARKRFLLILDEIKISASYNLDKLGVPHSSQRNKSSKVLITGAKYYLDLVAADRVLSLDCLPPHEAWCLFCDKAGVAFDSPDWHPVAEALVKDCFGVPLQIIIMAGALRNIEGDTSLNLEAKLDLASNLRTNRSLYTHSYTHEIGYAMLPSKAMKDCFLYCTLYPEYHHISVKGLITSWIMEGFIEGFNCLEDAYKEGQHILKELRDRYLLFKLDDDHVTMHDGLLHRQTYIKEEGSDMILAKAGMRLTIPELYTEQDSFKKIYLMDGSSKGKYPDYSEFPEPSTLLLHGHGNGGSLSSEIPDVFFRKMKNLRVLALVHARMRSLPSSFTNLNQLCALVLRGCGTLENLNNIQGLNKLQVLSLSGAHALKEIPEDLFGPMRCLQDLDLSYTQIKQLPSSLSNLFELRFLILRGCSYLEKLPCLRAKYLRVLDLSGASALREIDGRLLENMTSLELLDLSETVFDSLPPICNRNSIKYLLLRDCSHFDTLPCLDALVSLEVLDLSGARALRKFQDQSFGIRYYLRILDLSGTQVVQLPSLSECRHLHQLLLRGCSNLETLPTLNSELEVLDLSGATSFQRDGRTIPTGGNLFQLLLRGCLKLQKLPPLGSLERLNEIDLSGCIAFQKFQDLSFGKHLRILNLSSTQVAELPTFSKCTSLSQLLLRGCLKLVALPNLDALTELEVLDLSGATAFKRFSDESFGEKNGLKKLDLSGTQVEQLPSLSKCSRLFLLLLRGCSKLETLPSLEALTRLEVLDLYGATTFRQFPGESLGQKSGLKELDQSETYVACIHVTLSNTDIFHSIGHVGRRIRVIVSNTDIFHSIGNISQLWENGLQRFHICLCSLEELGKEEDIYFQRKEFIFRDAYYIQTRWLPQSTEPNKFLEIRGFQSCPRGIEGILSCTELLYLKNNAFITRLSDIGVENVKELKECWIHRCDAMESVFYGNETEENVALGRNLQNLWVSSLSELKSLCEGVAQSGSFTCLKNLYIDCCPSFIIVFSSGMELRNLETLHIKFCDEFESVCGEMALGESALPRLCKLTLWQLSELKSICGGVLPSLQNLKVGGCPKLQKLPLNVNRTSPPQIEIEGERKWWNQLKWEDEGIKSHLRFKQL